MLINPNLKQYSSTRATVKRRICHRGALIIGNPRGIGCTVKSARSRKKRTTAGEFKPYSEFMKLEGGLKDGLTKDEPVEMMKNALRCGS